MIYIPKKSDIQLFKHKFVIVIDDLIDMSAYDKQDSYVGNVASVHSFGAFDVVETNSNKIFNVV